MFKSLFFILFLAVVFWLGNLSATGKIINLTDLDSMKSCFVSLGKTCPDISPVFKSSNP